MKLLFAVVRARLVLWCLLLCGICPPLAAKPYVCMETNVGEFCMELLPEAAPATVANFLQYVADGDYSNSMIHLSDGNIVQGGGYTVFSNLISLMSVDAPVKDEYNQSNLRGTVAMARLGGRDSAMSQWFVNVTDNPSLDGLDGGATVFARVVKGMDVVDSIAALRRVNVANTYYEVFTRVPTTAPVDVALPEPTQFIRVQRAYRAETVSGVSLLPYQCSLTSPGDTLTEYCGSTLGFPVAVDGTLYAATLAFVPARGALVFAVAGVSRLADSGQARASFAGSTLTIPSVRVGNAVFLDVRLKLTSSAPLEFTLQGYTPR